jgi:hypothetical protein
MCQTKQPGGLNSNQPSPFMEHSAGPACAASTAAWLTRSAVSLCKRSQTCYTHAAKKPRQTWLHLSSSGTYSADMGCRDAPQGNSWLLPPFLVLPQRTTHACAPHLTAQSTREVHKGTMNNNIKPCPTTNHQRHAYEQKPGHSMLTEATHPREGLNLQHPCVWPTALMMCCRACKPAT